ncbi:MAG: DinB family protein [Fimbriimonadaceae bacterium]|nr:DinB family protein [Fimbriimonadaceae bacterium]
MDVTAALLDSWDRQCRIVNAIAERVTEANRHIKPSPDGWSLDTHLAHIQKVRTYFLTQLDADKANALGKPFKKEWEDPIDDLNAIRKMLAESSLAVRDAVKSAIEKGNEKAGWYDNPVLYLQHMVWHEGWHVGLIFLALRSAGEEPPEEWEEEKVWGEWRTEEWS